MDPPVEGATGPQAFSSRRDKQDWEQGKGLVLQGHSRLKAHGTCWFSVGGGWALWVWDSQKAASEGEEEREI